MTPSISKVLLYPPKLLRTSRMKERKYTTEALNFGGFVLLENLENVKSCFFQKKQQVNILTVELPRCLEAHLWAAPWSPV